MYKALLPMRVTPSLTTAPCPMRPVASLSVPTEMGPMRAEPSLITAATCPTWPQGVRALSYLGSCGKATLYKTNARRA